MTLVMLAISFGLFALILTSKKEIAFPVLGERNAFTFKKQKLSGLIG